MMFCQGLKTVFSLRRRNLFDKYTYTVANHFSQLNLSAWDHVNAGQNIFLSSSYLKTLASDEADALQYRYVIVYYQKNPVAIAFMQVINFSAELLGELVVQRFNDLQNKRASLFNKYVQKNRDMVIFRLLTFGNNYISGEHGMAFSKDFNLAEKYDLMYQVIKLISGQEKLRGKISAVLVKDFEQPISPEINPFTQNRFLEFAVEPNMLIKIPDNVHSIEDYVNLFSKKYRKRAKSIFNSSSQVSVRELDGSEVQSRNDEIYALYLQVFKNAKFKLVQLPSDYFISAKKNFQDKFLIHGYFFQDKLVGFQSAYLLDNHQLEAHFIGFDYENNARFELYQNMLYGFIRIALQYGKTQVNLGRTASEIKSTVGAKPQNLYCYIKPQNSVSKLILQPFISFLQPAQWIPRNPFRE